MKNITIKAAMITSIAGILAAIIGALIAGYLSSTSRSEKTVLVSSDSILERAITDTDRAPQSGSVVSGSNNIVVNGNGNSIQGTYTPKGKGTK
jgi:hypothetical protein